MGPNIIKRYNCTDNHIKIYKNVIRNLLMARPCPLMAKTGRMVMITAEKNSKNGRMASNSLSPHTNEKKMATHKFLNNCAHLTPSLGPNVLLGRLLTLVGGSFRRRLKEGTQGLVIHFRTQRRQPRHQRRRLMSACTQLCARKLWIYRQD